MKSVIYYFTGSGNSLIIAKDLKKAIENTEVIRITKHNEDGLDASDFDRVGFVFPIYFSGIPIMLRKFVKNLKINPDSYVYGVANFGDKVDMGMKQLETVLEGKGVQLKGRFEITMPGNYQVMFALDSKEKMEKNFSEEKKQILEIGKKVTDKETILPSKVGLGTKIKGALVYKIFKPGKMDKNFWSDRKCNGCGICKKICPAENITIVKNKPMWNRQCEQCLSCLHFCPKQAVQYRRGTIKRGRYKHPEISLKELVINGKV